MDLYADRRSGRPTLEDVAARTGVSRATVSRVVNHHPKVDPAMAQAVQRAIAELRYAPNRLARALMTNRTDAVALVAEESHTRVFGDPFFGGIIRGISQELAAWGKQLILSMIQDADEFDRVESYLLGHHVDGVLLISQHGHDRLATTLKAAHVPLVIGGRPMDSTLGLPYVDNDNVGGARLATTHLLEQGRTRVGTICGPQDMAAGVDRLSGCREALGDRFDPERVEEGDFSTPGGYAAATSLLTRNPTLDALFVANDLMAIGALAALRDLGRTVPGDVAVVGFDDIDLAAVADPPLTTVRQRTIDQGRTMVRLLLDLLAGGPATRGESRDGAASSILLSVDLIKRQSA